jgi:hypothetical protein
VPDFGNYKVALTWTYENMATTRHAEQNTCSNKDGIGVLDTTILGT